MNPLPPPQKVSVYIPACNVADFLAPCIEALLGQTLPADEILVIDDGSRDKSAEIASRYPQVTSDQSTLVEQRIGLCPQHPLHVSRRWLIVVGLRP